MTKASVARQKLVLRDKSKFDMTKARLSMTKEYFCLGYGDKSLLFSFCLGGLGVLEYYLLLSATPSSALPVLVLTPLRPKLLSAHIATAAAGRGLRYLNSRLVHPLLLGDLSLRTLVSQSHASNFSLAMSLGRRPRR